MHFDKGTRTVRFYADAAAYIAVRRQTHWPTNADRPSSIAAEAEHPAEPALVSSCRNIPPDAGLDWWHGNAESNRPPHGSRSNCDIEGHT